MSPCPFPAIITITPQAPPIYIYIYIYKMCTGTLEWESSNSSCIIHFQRFPPHREVIVLIGNGFSDLISNLAFAVCILHSTICIFWQHFFIDTYLIEHYRQFFCLHIFFVNPFELPYWSYDIRQKLVDKPSIIWCNGYRCKKWTGQHVFKSWMSLIAFHIALIPLGKVWIQLFSLQLWVNSRADWILQSWWGI